MVCLLQENTECKDTMKYHNCQIILRLFIHNPMLYIEKHTKSKDISLCLKWTETPCFCLKKGVLTLPWVKSGFTQGKVEVYPG